MMKPDLLFEKARAFTDTEVVTMQSWLVAAQAGRFALAKDILDVGLMAEHYKSLLPEDPAQITPAQSDQLRQLLLRFDEVIRKL